MRCFVIIPFLFYCFSFSQGQSTCYSTTYKSGASVISYTVYRYSIVSTQYDFELSIFAYDESEQESNEQPLYGKNTKSGFWLSKDSTLFNTQRVQGYFKGKSKMKITDLSILHFRPDTALLELDECENIAPPMVITDFDHGFDEGDGEYEYIPPPVPIPDVYYEPVELNYIENCEPSPSFLGGHDSLILFLKTNMIYPEISKEIGAEGTVYVQFIVEIDGSLSDVVILKGVEFHLNKEAIRLVKSMPKWIPGSDFNKELVRCRVILPVRFSLM